MEVKKQSSIEKQYVISTQFLSYIAETLHFYIENIELTHREDPIIAPLLFQPIDWVTV